MRSDASRIDHPIDECPLRCDVCREPGDCEDCLDCLLWPDIAGDEPLPIREPKARSSPVRTRDLHDARQRLDVGRRVGLVLRRARRRGRLSQAALARQVGWSASSMNRAENDASSMTLGRIDGLLRQVGHRLAVVEDRPLPAPACASASGELPDEVWGTEELLARDRRGRRFPPFVRLTWEGPLDRAVVRRRGGPLPEWTSTLHPDQAIDTPTPSEWT